MDTFLIAFEAILPLFLVIFTGVLFSRTKVSSEKWIEVLNQYSIWIGFPALVIASLMKLELGEKSYTTIILLNSAYIIVCLLLAFPISSFFGFSQKKKRTMFLILAFGNVAYLGMPVLANIFGEEIMPVAAIISAVYIFFLLTFAVILIEYFSETKLSIKKLLLNIVKNPLLLSVFVGLFLVVFNIKIPSFAEKTIYLFSDSVTAVVLFSLGIFLGKQKIGKPKEWVEVFIFSMVSMLVLPFAFYFFLRFSNLESNILKATVIDAAMPVGLTPFVISIQYNLESKLVARIVVLATLLSMIIIPLWMVILN